MAGGVPSRMAMAPMLEAALALRARGYAVHWLRPRSKIPLQKGWSTAEVMSVEALQRSYRPGFNAGVRCGTSSTPAPGMGFVVIDTDVRVPGSAPEAHAALADLLEGAVDGPAVRSGRGHGSRHHWFRAPLDRLPRKAGMVLRAAATTWQPPGKAQPEPVWTIEVLSTGKQVVVPPSIHPVTGHAYCWLVALGELPVLPESTHVAIARALAVSPAMVKSTPSRGHGLPGLANASGGLPGDHLNAQATWDQILEPHGWTRVGQRGEVTWWRRPGKREPGCSATTNYGGSDLLHVFSTNAAPFEPGHTYSKFAARALLEYGGDWQAAARALAAQGYGTGSRAEPPRPYRGYRALRYVPPAHDPWLGPRGSRQGIPTAVRVIEAGERHG